MVGSVPPGAAPAGTLQHGQDGLGAPGARTASTAGCRASSSASPALLLRIARDTERSAWERMGVLHVLPASAGGDGGHPRALPRLARTCPRWRRRSGRWRGWTGRSRRCPCCWSTSTETGPGWPCTRCPAWRSSSPRETLVLHARRAALAREAEGDGAQGGAAAARHLPLRAQPGPAPPAVGQAPAPPGRAHRRGPRRAPAARSRTPPGSCWRPWRGARTPTWPRASSTAARGQLPRGAPALRGAGAPGVPPPGADRAPAGLHVLPSWSAGMEERVAARGGSGACWTSPGAPSGARPRRRWWSRRARERPSSRWCPAPTTLLSTAASPAHDATAERDVPARQRLKGLRAGAAGPAPTGAPAAEDAAGRGGAGARPDASLWPESAALRLGPWSGASRRPSPGACWSWRRRRARSPSSPRTLATVVAAAVERPQHRVDPRDPAGDRGPGDARGSARRGGARLRGGAAPALARGRRPPPASPAPAPGCRRPRRGPRHRHGERVVPPRGSRWQGEGPQPGEVGPQRGGARVAVLRVLLHQLEHHALEGLGQTRGERARRRGLLLHVQEHERHRLRVAEGQLPGEQLIGHHAQRVEVRRG